MNILHHGGKFGVTGSCHELQVSPAASVLIDCGLKQGAETVAEGGKETSSLIDFPIAQVKAVVLTHVHVDHCGRLPYLIGAGFKGPIYCTEASAKLLPLVIQDALKVGVTNDEALVARFVSVLKKRLAPLPYGQWKELGVWDGRAVKIRLQQAGHILGSALVEIDVAGADVLSFKTAGAEVLGESSPVADSKGSTSPQFPVPSPGLSTRIVFSGDLGAPDTPLLPDPIAPERADVLVLESTYGDRLHEDRKGRKERLRKIIQKALRNKGTILIPAFSIGRTQELLYELEELIAAHRDEDAVVGLVWDDLEVVVDSPMALRVTEVYQELQPLWDAEAKQNLAAGRHPLSFDQMTVISSHEEHLQTVRYLKKTGRPCIVIAAGGMCSGGRIVNYLKTLLEDDRTDVLFVGYQAAGTAGREILDQGTGGLVDLDGKTCRIRAGVYSIGGYSAHADQKNLVDFVKAIPAKPGVVRLVHGEAGARKVLAGTLRAVGLAVEE